MRDGQQPELRPFVLCSPRSPNKPRECTGKCRQFNGFGLVQTGSGPGGRWFKSTRPDHFFRISNLPHTKIRIAPGALPGAQWFKSICPDSLFCLSNQCGALRSLLRLQLRLYGQYGQRHHIRGFAWKFEALLRPSHERRGTPLIFYFSLSLPASPIRIVPPNTMSARNPPRCKSPVRTPFVVSASRYWQGSHKRFPISRTEPTWNSRPTK